MISVITGTKKQSEIIKHLFIFVIPPFPGFFCIKIIVFDVKWPESPQWRRSQDMAGEVEWRQCPFPLWCGVRHQLLPFPSGFCRLCGAVWPAARRTLKGVKQGLVERCGGDQMGEDTWSVF